MLKKIKYGNVHFPITIQALPPTPTPNPSPRGKKLQFHVTLDEDKYN